MSCYFLLYHRLYEYDSWTVFKSKCSSTDRYVPSGLLLCIANTRCWAAARTASAVIVTLATIDIVKNLFGPTHTATNWTFRRHLHRHRDPHRHRRRRRRRRRRRCRHRRPRRCREACGTCLKEAIRKTGMWDYSTESGCLSRDWSAQVFESGDEGWVSMFHVGAGSNNR